MDWEGKLWELNLHWRAGEVMTSLLFPQVLSKERSRERREGVRAASADHRTWKTELGARGHKSQDKNLDYWRKERPLSCMPQKHKSWDAEIHGDG